MQHTYYIVGMHIQGDGGIDRGEGLCHHVTLSHCHVVMRDILDFPLLTLKDFISLNLPTPTAKE